MIITVQGMNHKNNKAVQTVSTLAGMDSLINGNKTLIVQLINPDIDTADNTLNKNTDIAYGIAKNSFAETGIDSLLRICAGTVLGTTEFEQFCTPMRRTKFALDVAEISKNVEFTKTLANRIEDIKEILTAAAEVYQNVYVLVDSKDDDLLKIVNEMDIVNRSVYCLRQGHMTKGDVYGKNILYVVTDFHGDSEFSMKSMKNAYVSKREPIYPLTFNIRATDAAMKGRLLYFLLRNTEEGKTDVNYAWYKDVRNILSGIEKMREAKEPRVKKDLDGYKKEDETGDFSMFTENAPLFPHKDAVAKAHEDLPHEELNTEKKPKKHSGLFSIFSKSHKPQNQDALQDETPDADESAIGLDGIVISSEIEDAPAEAEAVATVEAEEKPTKPAKKTAAKKTAPKKVTVAEAAPESTEAEAVKTTKTGAKKTTTAVKKTASTTKKTTVKTAAAKVTAETVVVSDTDLEVSVVNDKKKASTAKETATAKKTTVKKAPAAKDAAETVAPKAKTTRAKSAKVAADDAASDAAMEKPAKTATKKVTKAAAAKAEVTEEKVKSEETAAPKTTRARRTKKVEA